MELTGKIFSFLFLFFFFFFKSNVNTFLDFQPDYLRILRNYPQFPFGILIALDKIYFARIVLSWVKLDPYQ